MKKWYFETCKEAIKSCSNLKEFREKYGAAYHVCLKNGWLDVLFPKNK